MSPATVLRGTHHAGRGAPPGITAPTQPASRALLALVVVLHAVVPGAPAHATAQDQAPETPGWPCTAGRPVDPSYLAVAEATGGQLFMLQPGEAEYAGHLVIATQTHPATIDRAVGQLRGQHVFMVPSDGSVESLFIAVSLQCRQIITVERPDGVLADVTNAAEDVDLKTGRLTRVEVPLPGTWRVTVSGQGLFAFSALAKTPLTLAASVAEPAAASTPTGDPERGRLTLDLALSAPVDQGRVILLTASGDPLASHPLPAERDGRRRLVVMRPPAPFRVAVEGVDSEGAVVRRVHAALLQPE